MRIFGWRNDEVRGWECSVFAIDQSILLFLAGDHVFSFSSVHFAQQVVVAFVGLLHAYVFKKRPARFDRSRLASLRQSPVGQMMVEGGLDGASQRGLTSHDMLYSISFVKSTIWSVRETSLDKGIVFPSYTHFIYTDIPTVPNNYRALVCLSTLHTVICLVWSFCSLGQMFASGFFRIPPHDEHPCL